ncbi:hypothetical protein, variant 1 [Capsaspora owczarzaki ATCC 30864]|nr:hypothetical protein, variant 1 [Capsaspora owczarzaki ATCC 30864]
MQTIDDQDQCQPQHFAEHSEVAALVAVVCAAIEQPSQATAPATNPAEEEEEELHKLTRACERIADVLQRYQELPQLLDRHLRMLVSPLMGALRTAMHRIGTSAVAGQPSTLQGNVAADVARLDAAARLLYALCKVRGFKTITNLFPNGVADLHEAMTYMRWSTSNRVGSAREPWETTYVLLLWLWVLAAIPFSLAIIDAQAADDLVAVCMARLPQGGKPSEAAALVLSRLLTRPDLCEKQLGGVLEVAIRDLSSSATAGASMSHVYKLIGVLALLTSLFQAARRADLAHAAPKVMAALETSQQLTTSTNALVIKLCIKLSQRLALAQLKPRLAAWRYQRGARSLTGNLAGSAETQSNSTEPHPANQEAEEQEKEDDSFLDHDTDPAVVESAIEHMLGGLRNKDTIVRWSAAKGIGRITARLPLFMADQVVDAVIALASPSELEHAWHGSCLAVAELSRHGLILPARLADVVPIVLNCVTYDVRRGATSVGSNVRDAACYACWSFARAYTPETLLPFLPALTTALVVQAVFDREVNCRRAASASLQELVGRQKGSVPNGIDIIVLADYIAVGNIRHAMLEVAPAIAAIHPRQYATAMVKHLVRYTCKHWDASMRQLAAAALHRLTFVHPACMVEPSTAAKQAQSPVEMLLSSTAAVDTVTRHGALLGLGCIVHGLSIVQSLAAERSKLKEQPSSGGWSDDVAKFVDTPQFWKTAALQVPSSTALEIALLPQTFEANAPLLKGATGELLITGICVLIHRLCIAGVAEGVRAHRAESTPGIDFAAWQRIVDRRLFRDVEDYSEAVDAFYSMAFHLQTEDAELLALVDRYLAACDPTSTAAATPREGIIQALGRLPVQRLLPQYTSAETASAPAALTRLFASLARMVRTRDGPHAVTAGARKCAATSLASLTLALHEQLDSSNFTLAATSALNRFLPETLDALLTGLLDYTIDNRGDIGSLVREACIAALGNIFSRFYNETAENPAAVGLLSHFTPSDKASVATMFARSLVRMSLEKIERTRDQAGQTLSRLASLARVSSDLLHATEIQQLLPLSSDIQWLSPASCFPVAVHFLHMEAYRHDALCGLLISIGGLTESLVRFSHLALVQLVRDIRQPEHCQQLATALVDVFRTYRKVDRVSIPILKALDILLNDGTLALLLEKGG